MREVVLLACVLAGGAHAAPVHVWEKQELTFTSEQSYGNPYADVAVWVDLQGPNFNKRVYGFWDGGRTFRVRVTATAPGAWTWRSGSNPQDAGLAGKSGSFTAAAWTEEEKRQNPLRRGFLRATANQHALEQADGTPFFAIGDTWYSTGTNRFKWYDDDRERPLGPEAGFKDYVRFRKAQGYNWVNIIAAFPNWMTDGQPWRVVMNDAEKTTVRSAWLEFGANSAKNMDNEGGRPFVFPGKVPGYENMFPDVNRINPEYFRYLDRKIDYLNDNGFVPFIEVSRRDASMCWYKYYGWPDSYARFIQYIWSRYQANNTVLSPIHLDIIAESISPDDYLAAIRVVKEKYGDPPFGTLLSANANPSTLENWGENSWVTLHQIGNMREHNNYWYLTEIYRSRNPKPALNGEPYYSGYFDARGQNGGYKFGAPGGTEQDDQFVRSGMYGSLVSGGFAGHVYGAEGIWGADIEPTAPVKMWDAFQWNSGAQMKHLRTFAFSIGKRYQELVPDADLVSPNKTHVLRGYEGWAYCARTPDQEVFLAYFEKGCPRSQIRGARLNSTYRTEWFDPRNGTWQEAGKGTVQSSRIGIILLPEFPADNDWGLRLTYQASASARSAAVSLGAFEGQTDVGKVLQPGTVQYDAASRSYTVSGSGENMWAATDDFQFVWKKVTGDITLTADAAFLGSGGNAHRKAVLMVRQSLDTDSAYADVALHGDGLTSLQSRETKGAATHEVQANIAGPNRLRLTKRGNQFAIFLGREGEEPRFAGGAMLVPMEGEFYVGIGVCAHDKDRVERAVFSNVELTGGSASTAAAVQYSTLETVPVASTDRRVSYVSTQRMEAPVWTNDGASLVFNAGGRMQRIPFAGGKPEAIDTGSAVRWTSHHGFSPDGSVLAVSDGSNVYTVPSGGGAPRRVTKKALSIWNGWSPDGKTLLISRGSDIYSVPAAGGKEVRLTKDAGRNQGAEYAPDGQHIYFSSDRSGTMQIWRMRADGTEPEQVTADELANRNPHVSPDGRQLVFLSGDNEVLIRMMSLNDKQIRVLAKMAGGTGTMESPSWSPDSRRVAYVNYPLIVP